MLISRLFGAVANEAPGPFAPGAHGAWPCLVAAGLGAALTCGHQNTCPHCRGSRPSSGGHWAKVIPGPLSWVYPGEALGPQSPGDSRDSQRCRGHKRGGRLSESWQTRSWQSSTAKPLASGVSLPRPLFLEINDPFFCTCTFSFWSRPHDVSNQTALPGSLWSDGGRLGDSRGFHSGACLSAQADRCPLLQEVPGLSGSPGSPLSISLAFSVSAEHVADWS